MRRVAFLPLLFVAGYLAFSLWLYPATPAKPTLEWQALSDFYNGPFRDAGFFVTCVEGSQQSCGVDWRNPNEAAAPATRIYTFGDDQLRKRDEVLRSYYAAARAVVGEGEARQGAAALDGFFQSGLRRLADRAGRRARESSFWTLHLPPFKLGDPKMVKGVETREVNGIDATFSTISTGLPSRPAYRADVLAFSGIGDPNGVVSAIRIVAPHREPVVRILDSRAGTTCQPVSPDEGGAPLPCQSVTITDCAPDRAPLCRFPVVEVHAIAPGVTLVRAAQNQAAKLLWHDGQPVNTDEMLLLKSDMPFEALQVQASSGYVDFRIEVIQNGSVPVSRQRMVNGRWDRWYDASVKPWLEPVVSRLEQKAATGSVNPIKPVTLSLDLNLQHELETQLGVWMRDHAESAVRSHILWHVAHGRHRLSYVPWEPGNHRRPVPHAGITVLDAANGSVLAAASYPPAEALALHDDRPAFAPGWRERLVGLNLPEWAAAEVLETLDDRLNTDTNANFVTHPIGSTFKPILLSLVMDPEPPSGTRDGLSQLFNLMVVGHPPESTGEATPITCPECQSLQYQAVAGLPVGPWGDEDGGGGGHRNDPWIDHSDFLVASCNKYAITLGVLSLLDWEKRGNDAVCCWNARRDSFALTPNQSVEGNSAPPRPEEIYDSPKKLPPVGRWLDAQTLTTNSKFPDAPIFQRLSEYYGIPSRSEPNAYDPAPWTPCTSVNPGTRTPPPIGTLVKTQLMLTDQVVGTAFTNIFTGAGHNWWSNVKLAEAYARLALNHPTSADFCGGHTSKESLFRWTSRHQELLQILSRQRDASWVKIPEIKRWLAAGATRAAISKTGTSLRQAGYESTGVFAIYLGQSADGPGRRPNRLGGGIVVVAHVDDIGGSSDVTALVDFLFPLLRSRAQR